MKKVITFGELMLRLAPENYLRFVQSEKYEATFGGAEANVAVSLANYGVDVAFVSKLPAHEIGQAAVNSLRKFGVDTSKVVRGGERVGICWWVGLWRSFVGSLWCSKLGYFGNLLLELVMIERMGTYRGCFGVCLCESGYKY